jgi:uncharacterized protein YciI
MKFGKRPLVAAALLPLFAAPLTRALESSAVQPNRMMTVYLVLLKKGPAWTAEETPATKAIQEAHMANIRRMWAEQHLIVAGPVEDREGLRGIFVLQAASLDAAKMLAASDPAVKAGRLRTEVYPWWIERGVLPEAGQYCAPPGPANEPSHGTPSK